MRWALFLAIPALLAMPSLPQAGRGPDLGTCQFQVPADATMIGFGVYEGQGRTRLAMATRGNRLRSVKTFVARQSGPVYLVLSSYEPVLWELMLEPGTRIGGVLAMGYYAQAIANLPEHVPVAFSTYEDGSGIDCPKPQYVYGMKDPKFGMLQGSLQGRYGRSMSEFHGTYAAECLPRGCNPKAGPAGAAPAKPSFWQWFFGMRPAAPPSPTLPIRASTDLVE